VNNKCSGQQTQRATRPSAVQAPPPPPPPHTHTHTPHTAPHLPSSATIALPVARSISTSTRVACPACTSSTELSSTSHSRWWRPRVPVLPMYMPGRLRTGSRPSRTCARACVGAGVEGEGRGVPGVRMQRETVDVCVWGGGFEAKKATTAAPPNRRAPESVRHRTPAQQQRSCPCVLPLLLRGLAAVAVERLRCRREAAWLKRRLAPTAAAAADGAKRPQR